MRIGIIGSGKMGSTLGTLWGKAGHEVFFSSRQPEELGALVKRTPRATAGTVDEAARFADVVFIGVPSAAMPELARQLTPLIAGKVVLDAANLVPARDGALAATVKESGKGSGTWTQSLMPGARVVKAFNTVRAADLASEAHRGRPRIGVPLAGNDARALEQAAALVRDAGSEPVVLPGEMAASAQLDFGGPVWNTKMTADEIRVALGAPAPPTDRVQHVEANEQGTFFLEREGSRLATMTYSCFKPWCVTIDSTEVSDALRGQGVGRQLLDALVAWARETNTRVVPVCPWVKAQFEKDPSIRDVLESLLSRPRDGG